jgi:hypothetical protein
MSCKADIPPASPGHIQPQAISNPEPALSLAGRATSVKQKPGQPPTLDLRRVLCLRVSLACQKRNKLRRASGTRMDTVTPCGNPDKRPRRRPHQQVRIMLPNSRGKAMAGRRVEIAALKGGATCVGGSWDWRSSGCSSAAGAHCALQSRTTIVTIAAMTAAIAGAIAAIEETAMRKPAPGSRGL